MTVTFNPAKDFAAVIDGLEAVTLTTRDGATLAVAKALRRAVTTRESEDSDGKVLADDVNWHLPVDEAATRPALGSTITDSGGEAWTVVSVAKRTLGSRWTCHTRNLIVVHSLDTLVTFQLAAPAQDEHGATETKWSNWKPNVRAKIQPLRIDASTENDARTALATHIVYLADDLDVGPQHRIVDGQSRAFQIERTERAERIGELMRVFVREEGKSE